MYSCTFQCSIYIRENHSICTLSDRVTMHACPQPCELRTTEHDLQHSSVWDDFELSDSGERVSTSDSNHVTPDFLSSSVGAGFSRRARAEARAYIFVPFSRSSDKSVIA